MGMEPGAAPAQEGRLQVGLGLPLVVSTRLCRQRRSRARSPTPQESGLCCLLCAPVLPKTAGCLVFAAATGMFMNRDHTPRALLYRSTVEAIIRLPPK
jgi:hypothetical protein